MKKTSISDGPLLKLLCVYLEFVAWFLSHFKGSMKHIYKCLSHEGIIMLSVNFCSVMVRKGTTVLSQTPSAD